MFGRKKIKELELDNAYLRGQVNNNKQRIELLENHNRELVKDYGKLVDDYVELSLKHGKIKNAYVMKNNEWIELKRFKQSKGEKKMTNFEYYKDEILKLSDGDSISVVNGKPGPCSGSLCSKCDLSGYGSCTRELMKWGYTEHIEKPKLDKRERMFCELVQVGWIIRDNDGHVHYYTFKPKKGIRMWSTEKPASGMRINDFRLQLDFEFIKWQDEEPWSVQELLKLEVEE